MKKTVFLILCFEIFSCTNSQFESIPEYLKIVGDIYSGQIDITQRKYLSTSENETIITLSNCQYIDQGAVDAIGVTNNCAIQLYTKYGNEIGRLTMDVIKNDSVKYSYHYEISEIKKMIHDYPQVKKHIALEIDALINRDFDKLYEIHLMSQPDTPKENFLDDTNKLLSRSFTNSYSKSHIIGIQRGRFNNAAIYVINSSIFDAKGNLLNIYETLIKISIFD